MIKIKENCDFIAYSKLVPNSKKRMLAKKEELEAKGYFCFVQEKFWMWVLCYCI
jgi:hypothetical protein